MGRGIKTRDLSIYPGWESRTKNNLRKKHFVHVPTGMRTTTVPGIVRVIKAYADVFSSLRFKYANVVLKVQGLGEATAAADTSSEEVHETAPMLALCHHEPLVEQTCTQVHMCTFDALLEEFKVWRTSSYKTFQDLGYTCTPSNRNAQFITKLYDYLQCEWYHRELLILCSTLTAHQTIHLTQWSGFRAPFTTASVTDGFNIHIDEFSAAAAIEEYASFAIGRGDLYTRYRDGSRIDLAFWIDKFSEDGTKFVIARHADTGRIVGLLSFSILLSLSKVRVYNILTYQADNKLATLLNGGLVPAKGMGSCMFKHGLVMCVSYNGGGHIYAECVREGIGGSRWSSHPMKETSIGNFIWLQMALNGSVDEHCVPKTMYVAPHDDPPL